MTCFDPACKRPIDGTVVWLEDDAGNVWPFCSEACANQPWPMSSYDENEAGHAAELYAQQERARQRVAIASALEAKGADDLRALVQTYDDEKFALVEATARLQEQVTVLMDELEDAISVRDSLSTQLVDANARANVHKKEFPKMIFHRDGKTCVVQDKATMRTFLRTGEWFDHPDKAEASRKRVYQLKNPEPAVINEKPNGELASLSPKERGRRINAALQQDRTHVGRIDNDRIDVTITQGPRDFLADGVPLLLCTRCHDPQCKKSHAGHFGRCEGCGREALVTSCARRVGGQ